MSDYQYTVEGERVTLNQIVARFPKISRKTPRYRIDAGLRTWAALGLDTKLAAKKQRGKMARMTVKRI